MGQWTCKSETMSELGSDEISRERDELGQRNLRNVKYNPLFDSKPYPRPPFLERSKGGGKSIRKGDNPREIYRRSSNKPVTECWCFVARKVAYTFNILR